MKIASVIAIGSIMTLAICLAASSVDQVELRSQVANLGMPEFTWTNSNFAGFYYDIDKNIGTEQVTFRLSDINPDSATLSDQPDAHGLRGIVYITKAQQKNFQFKPWGQCEIIGFLSDEYFASYDSIITSNMQAVGESVAYLYDKSKSRNLLNNEQISKVLIDSDIEQTITSPAPLKLSEGYQLAIKSLDVTTNKAYLELSKNGRVVDNKVVQPSIPTAKMFDKTYYYKVNLGDAKDIIQIAVHFKNAFKTGSANITTIDGVFQISDTINQIKVNQQYDNMSIRRIDPTGMTIAMDNKGNQITLSKNKDILLMSNFYIRTSSQDIIDASQPLRYYIYKKYTEPGIYQLRGSVANLGQNEFTLDKSTFPAFYYDIDSDLGAEQLTFRLSDSKPERATLSDQPDANGFRGMVYTTQAQPKDFKFRPWGQYEVIGFLGYPYFAAYEDTTTADIQAAGESVAYLFDRSKNRNLMTNEQIGKVLIDTDAERTITSDNPLMLSEGYELALKFIDTSANKAYLELSKNGQILDSSAIQPSIDNAKMSDKTYYYIADLGDTKQIVQIAVHFKNAFVGSDTNVATIDGIFQISDTSMPVKVDQQYDKMSIRTVDSSSLSIIMDNRDNQFTLSKNKDISLMQGIHIKTADQDYVSAENPLRYYIYEATTIGNVPPPNYPPIITDFVSSKDRYLVPGESVIFTATVSDPDVEDHILYRFFLNGEPVTDWVPYNQWTWNTTESTAGNDLVEIRVRDQNHAGQDSFDDRKTLELGIAKNQPPVITNFVSSKDRNVVPGDTVIFTATASDPDARDHIFYRFLLNSQPVTEWMPQNQWIWNPTTSNVGKNQVEVRVIDEKHAGIDRFDDRENLEFIINSQPSPPSGGNINTKYNILAFLLLLLINILIVVSKLIYKDRSDVERIPWYYRVLIKGILCTIVVVLAYYSGLEAWSPLIIIWLGLFIGPELLIHDIVEKSIVALAKFLASKGLSLSIFAFLEYVTIPHILDIPNGTANFGDFEIQVTNSLKTILIFVSMLIIILISSIFESIYEKILNKVGLSLLKGWVALIVILLILNFFVHPIYQERTDNGIRDESLPENLSRNQIIDLAPETSGPYTVNSSIVWTAVVANPDSHILYRFFLNEKPETDWIRQNHWTWTITDANVGANKVEVRIKNDRNTNSGDYFDDAITTICMINKAQ